MGKGISDLKAIKPCYKARKMKLKFEIGQNCQEKRSNRGETELKSEVRVVLTYRNEIPQRKKS